METSWTCDHVNETFIDMEICVSKNPMLGLMFCCAQVEILNLEQGSLHFYFALRSPDYAASLE